MKKGMRFLKQLKIFMLPVLFISILIITSLPAGARTYTEASSLSGWYIPAYIQGLKLNKYIDYPGIAEQIKQNLWRDVISEGNSNLLLAVDLRVEPDTEGINIIDTYKSENLLSLKDEIELFNKQTILDLGQKIMGIEEYKLEGEAVVAEGVNLEMAHKKKLLQTGLQVVSIQEVNSAGVKVQVLPIAELGAQYTTLWEEGGETLGRTDYNVDLKLSPYAKIKAQYALFSYILGNENAGEGSSGESLARDVSGDEANGSGEVIADDNLGITEPGTGTEPDKGTDIDGNITPEPGVDSIGGNNNIEVKNPEELEKLLGTSLTQLGFEYKTSDEVSVTADIIADNFILQAGEFKTIIGVKYNSNGKLIALRYLQEKQADSSIKGGGIEFGLLDQALISAFYSAENSEQFLDKSTVELDFDFNLGEDVLLNMGYKRIKEGNEEELNNILENILGAMLEFRF